MAAAEEMGQGSTVVEWLRAGPPARAKGWAEEHGLPERLHPRAGHDQPEASSAGPAPGGGGAPGVQELEELLRAAGVVEPGHDAGARGVRGRVVRRQPGRPHPDDPRFGARGRGQGRGNVPRPGGDVPVRGDWVRSGAVEGWYDAGLGSQVETAMSRQGQDRDERHLLSGVPAHPQRARGGTNETTRWQLDNGQVAFHKPFSGLRDDIAKGFGQSSAQQPVHEAAAWRLAERLGEPYRSLVPPCVLREVEGKMGSFALERPGVPSRGVDTVDEGELRAAAFFDCLIGQQDRHRNNYLVSGDRLTLIDHGYAFAKPGNLCNFSDFVTWRGQHETRLNGAEIDALDKVLDSEDAGGLRGLIEDDRLDALLGRAQRMRNTGRLLGGGQY